MSKADLLRERIAGAIDDPDAFWELVSPEVVWDISDTDSPMAGVYRGRGAAQEFWDHWLDAFSEWRAEIQEAFETEATVVFFVREHGLGRGSGIAVEMQRANLWRFKEGKVVGFKSFRDREQALREAGIDPPRIG